MSGLGFADGAEEQIERLHRASEYDVALDRAARIYQARFARLARRLMRDEQAGDDVSQDAWAAISRNFAAFRWDCTFATWAYTIVLRSATDARKRARCTPTRAADPISETALPASLPSEGRRLDARSWIESAIAKLSDDDLALFALYAEQRSAADVADVLHIKAEAVRVRIHRLLKKVRQGSKVPLFGPTAT